MVWSNQLTAVGSAEPDAPVGEMPALDSYSEPWTRRLPVQGHGEECVCVVVERMRPEYADTVPMSISVTGQLSDSGKGPQLLPSKRRCWARSGTLKAAFSLSSKILLISSS